MANDEVNPFEFTREDEWMGARKVADPHDLVRTVTPTGREWLRRKGRSAGGVRDRILMGQMKATMAALWADGKTYEQIATTVSDFYDLEGDQRLKGNSIHYHIKNMLDYWRQKSLALMDERQALILTRFDQIESLALEAYFASMEGKDTSFRSKQIDRVKSRENKDRQLKKNTENRKDFKFKVRQNLGQSTVPEEDRDRPLWVDTGELLDLDLMEETQERIVKNKRHESNRAGDPKFLMIIYNINVQRAKILGLYNKKKEDDPDSEFARLSDEERQQKVATMISAAKTRRANAVSLLAPPQPLGGFKKEQPKVVVAQSGWGNLNDDEEEDTQGWDD